MHDTFGKLEFWTANATRYCDRAQQHPDSAETETTLDAACLAALEVGELVKKGGLMQRSFRKDYGTETFFDIRRMRNLVAHTDDLSGKPSYPSGRASLATFSRPQFHVRCFQTTLASAAPDSRSRQTHFAHSNHCIPTRSQRPTTRSR